MYGREWIAVLHVERKLIFKQHKCVCVRVRACVRVYISCLGTGKVASWILCKPCLFRVYVSL